MGELKSKYERLKELQESELCLSEEAEWLLTVTVPDG